MSYRTFTPLPVIAGIFAHMASPSTAQLLVGQAEVIDGDSITVDGSDINLSGIDAPELRQQCQRGGEQWACGDESRRQLRDFIAGRAIRCESQNSLADDTPLATCTAGTLDLAGAMVEAGLAVALGSATTGYGPDAERARRNHTGLWSSNFQLPADWRAANPSEIAAPPPPASPTHPNNPVPRRMAGRASNSVLPAASAVSASGSCRIKGNRNREGEWIYHLPGMPYYDRTRPEEWFCTEAQAQAAGYRRAIVRR